MKKILIFILCMSFLTVTFSVQSFAENHSYHTGLVRNPLLPDGYDLCEYLLNKGDVNKDGKITASDARIVLRAAASLENLTEYQRTMADMIVDGEITAADARSVLQLAASIDTNVFRIRVVTDAGKAVTLGPLKGNGEYCWYIRELTSLYPPHVEESVKNISDDEFEQTFEISVKGFYYATLVYGSADGKVVIREYEFEIDSE